MVIRLYTYIYIYVYTYKTSLKADKEEWGGDVWICDWINTRQKSVAHNKLETMGSTWANKNDESQYWSLVLFSFVRFNKDLEWCWYHFEMRLVSFRKHCGMSLEPVHNTFDIIVQSFWHNVGMTLTSFWNDFNISLPSFWHHFGIILEWCWHHFGITLASFWNDLGTNLEWTWHRFGMTFA